MQRNPAITLDRRAEEIMDVLVVISVVSKRLAGKIAKLKKEGEASEHERNE